MKEPVAFLTNLKVASEFFERCSTLKEDTRENREKLLEEMVKELKAVRMNETDVKRYVKGKKVAVVRKAK